MRGEAIALAAAGRALLQADQPGAAELRLRAALRIEATLHQAQSDLGFALRALGRSTEAEAALVQAVRLDPADVTTRNRLGTVLRELGRYAEAEQQYRAALELAPDDADLYNNLGTVKNEQGAIEPAEQCFRAAIALQPGHAMAQCNLGLILGDAGRRDEAERCFLAAMHADPGYFYARINFVMNKLRVVYASESDATEARRDYETALEELVSSVDLDDSKAVHGAAETIGWVSPFYLSYLGQNDRSLQHTYGGFVCALMAKRYPEFAGRPKMPPFDAVLPLRIGIVSAFFFDHSNWKMPIRGWLEHIDRNRFEVFGYYTGLHNDSETRLARSLCGSFREGMPFEALARRIRDDNLHVLIYPEIGMDPVTTKLASLRLAPIQCNSWGHPVTSGMPTIDYFISAELMEPTDGHEHYTETLLRLPGTSLYYEPPRIETLGLSRAELGLDDGAVLYCCAQSLYKYLPQFDVVFTQIASRVPAARFVFFSSQRSAGITQQFADRLTTAFAMAGLDAGNHVVMMPRLGAERFRAVVTCSDVFLDSVGWSGCNTTLEALGCDVPVITCRGSLMRGLHSAAFLQAIQLDECVATDVSAYIELAVRVGNDGSLRSRLRHEIKARRHLAYRDLAPVRALERFLAQAVDRPSDAR